MNTIGDLMTSLEESDVPCIWMSMMCRHSNQEGLAVLKSLPIREDVVAYFCMSIVSEIRSYLSGVDTEERFASTLREGHDFLEAVFDRVKDRGIRKEAVCIPISYGEMAEQAGVVQIKDGMVSLTEKGEAVAKEVKNPTPNESPSCENCGYEMMRRGTCWWCPNCRTTLGCD